MLQKQLPPSDSFNKGRSKPKFSRGHQIISFFFDFEHISTYSYLNDHSVQLIMPSKALAVNVLILQASLPLEATQKQMLFYWHLLKEASCAN
jgi:hypothetical protein